MSGVEVAPAPWQLKGRSWIFTLSGLAKNASFPAGFSAPYEAEVLTSSGEFIGGNGLVQIVSYTESPVGPYDELIYIPGRWKYADGSTGFRVTRIYVSSKASTENGRRNWNIPKQVADFDFKTSEDGTSNLSVSLPGETKPFFQATVTPITLLSRIGIPYSASILGKYFTLIQPPLPAGDKPEEVATSSWAELIPDMRGTAYLMHVAPGLDGKVGDGVAFPAVVPWSVAIDLKNLTLGFGVPTSQAKQ